MKNSLLIKVLLAILLAIIVGWLTGPDKEIFNVTYVRIFGLIGQLFLNALTLVVIPLVASSIITGVAKIGSDTSFGKLGFKTFGYFIATNIIAILIGLIVTLAIAPGLHIDQSLSSLGSDNIEKIASMVQGDMFDKISLILLKIVPSNILAVASQGQILGMIGFCILFGYVITKIEERPAEIILGFWKAIFQVMMYITHLVMKFLPIGVFGLVAKVVATTGLDAIKSVMIFATTIIGALAIYALLALPSLLSAVGRVNPIAHFKAMAPALVTAFSTSSTAVTLPITMECVEKRAFVSNRVCSFVIPLASSLNLSGTALYICSSVIFIAQAYGLDLSFATLFVIVLMTFFTSMGMAGIPSAGLISIVLILHTIGLPAEGIGLILAVERLLDMCRTTVSVFGNSCCAVLVAKSEGEKDVLRTLPSFARDA